MVGEIVVGVDDAELSEKSLGFPQAIGRGRVEEAQMGAGRVAPLDEVERERREIRVPDFGRCVIAESFVFELGPQPITTAGRGATGSSSPLIGRRP
jgi:hypothetical protein